MLRHLRTVHRICMYMCIKESSDTRIDETHSSDTIELKKQPRRSLDFRQQVATLY